MQTYSYFQPEYVKNFKCDGQACRAHCCKRWRIEIDDKTFQKYSRRTEIVEHIEKIDGKNFVRLDENLRCPFLTAENLCSIQKNLGEEFLSETCATYPRRTWSFKNFYERALTLTCPVVMANVLFADEPMRFERVEVPEIIHSNFDRITISFSPVPVELWQYIVKIQSAAIYILQKRELSIDGRLIVLGFFLDRLDEMIDNYSLEEIDKLTEIYASADFVEKYAPIFAQSFKFDAQEFIKIMSGVFETLQINADAEDYLKFSDFRKNFVAEYSTVFENFLVNEFFMNQYPWKFQTSIPHNFGVFAAIYKMLEITMMSTAISKSNLTKNELAAQIRLFLNNIDHDNSYVNKISEQLSGKNNTAVFIQSLLQG